MSRFLRILAVCAGLFVLVLALGFGAGSKLEESNAFCQRCHVHDDIYGRFISGRVKDLAGEHGKEGVKCIDCHREPGLGGHLFSFGRASVALGRYLVGAYDRPIRAASPPSNGVCQKCHTPAAKGEMKIKGHYHSASILLKGSSRMTKPALCATCHSLHDPAVKKTHWVARSDSEAACKRCHSAMGEGGEDEGHEDGEDEAKS